MKRHLRYLSAKCLRTWPGPLRKTISLSNRWCSCYHQGGFKVFWDSTHALIKMILELVVAQEICQAMTAVFQSGLLAKIQEAVCRVAWMSSGGCYVSQHSFRRCFNIGHENGNLRSWFNSQVPLAIVHSSPRSENEISPATFYMAARLPPRSK